MSVFARPETFARKLVEKEVPYKSNDANKKGLLQRINEAAEKRKIIFAFLNSGKDIPPELLPKKPKVVKLDPMRKLYKRQASPQERAEMAELQQTCLDDGVRVADDHCVSAIVYDNSPKYMQQILDDYRDDKAA